MSSEQWENCSPPTATVLTAHCLLTVLPELENIVAFLEETPALLRRLGAGLTAEDLRRKPDGDEFSFVEQACHLRDIEREGYAVRLRRLLAEKDPLLADIDGAALARERRYAEQEFEPAADEFAQVRTENVAVLRGLSAEQLGRTGRFEGVGEVTVGELLKMMHEHDREHREQLEGLRESLSRRRTAAV